MYEPVPPARPITVPAKPKFIQIAPVMTEAGYVELYSLDQDGQVWRFDDYQKGWRMLPRKRVREE